MKAVFVSYNQALTDPMQEILDDLGVRGFTKWELTMGRGSFDGEPHYGTHAWLLIELVFFQSADERLFRRFLAVLRRFGRMACYSKSSVFMIFMIRNWRRSTVSMANNTTDATAPTAAKMKPPVMNFHSVRKMNTTSAIEQSVIRNFRPFITVG